jgi:hypothetical protein
MLEAIHCNSPHDFYKIAVSHLTSVIEMLRSKSALEVTTLI